MGSLICHINGVVGGKVKSFAAEVIGLFLNRAQCCRESHVYIV